MFDKMIGAKIRKIFFNEEFLKFETDKGNFVFTVEGECCSQSVFYDFYGVKKLLKGNPIVSIKDIELKPNDIKQIDGEEKDKKSYQESIDVYGYEIVTKDPKLGEVTSVVSFRNYSNGYYGGWMITADDRDVLPQIYEDIIETIPNPL